MLSNVRFWGVLVWLFAFQIFAATGSGFLNEHIWLNMGTVVSMFMVAAFLLGYSLPESNALSFASIFLLIAAASALMTVRFYELTPYYWYDLMTIIAAPQVFVMAIAGLLATRRQVVNDMQHIC